MPMRRWRKLLLAAATLVVASIAFAGWYRFHYSMDAVRGYEVNDPGAARRVLIATQGSEFKDAVVAGVIAHLKARSVYVKVIDVSSLADVNEDNWNAIVLVHTWEMRKPPAAVKQFMDRTRDARKIVDLTTSGSGDFKLEGVDAISTASVVADAPARAAEVARKVDDILRGSAGR
jgi:hypothetical protein